MRHVLDDIKIGPSAFAELPRSREIHIVSANVNLDLLGCWECARISQRE